MKTITLMSKLFNGNYIYDRPRRVINDEPVWIYSVLSIAGGASPLHYWTPAHAVMEDWTQDQLDRYASFQGVSAVHSLRLKDEVADALIAKIHSKSIDNSPKEPANN